MSYLVTLLFLLPTLLWLLVIRPYCIRNGRGYTPGATMGITFWVDWQEAKELAREKGDRTMMSVCRAVFWLPLLPVAVFVLMD